MPPIIWWQVDSSCFMVGCDDHAQHIHDTILMTVLLINAEHFRGCSSIDLQVFIESVPIHIPHGSVVTNTKNDVLEKWIEPTHQLRRSDVMEVPRSDSS